MSESSGDFDLDLPPPELPFELNLIKKQVETSRLAEKTVQSNEPETDPSEAPHNSPPPKKKIGFFRLALDFIGLVILLIIAAGVLLELYLPREKLRILAEQQLSKSLNIPVSIGKLGFSLLTGVELSELNIGIAGNLFRARSVVLDYDLTQLFKGKFILNEAAIDYPEITLISQKGIWNFQALLELSKTPKKPTPTPKEPTGLPPIPIAAVLNELRVQNLRFLLNQDNDLVARLDGLSLNATGNFNLDEIRADLSVIIDAPKDKPNLEFRQFSTQTDVKTNLSTALTVSAKNLWQFVLDGRLSLSNNFLKVEKILHVPNISTDFRASVNLRNESAQLENLLLQIGKNNQINMNGIVARFKTNPVFQTVISSVHLDLSELESLAKPLNILPPMQLSGAVDVQDLQIIGELVENQLKTIEVPKGLLSLENVSVQYPKMEVSVENLSTDASLSNIRLENLIPRSARTKLKIKLDSATFKNFKANDFEQTLEFIGSKLGLTENDIQFKTSLKLAEIDHPEFGKIKTDFSANGSARGNFAKGDFESLKVLVTSGPLEALKLEGQVLNFGKTSFNLSQFLKINLNQIKSFLPVALWNQTNLSKLDGTITETISLKGILKEDFSPKTAEASIQVNIKETNATVPIASIQNLNLKTNLDASFVDGQKLKIPAIKIDLNVDKAEAPNIAVIGPIKAQSTIKMNKAVPISGNFGMVPVSNQTNISLESIKLLKPVANLSDLTIATNLKADIYPKEQDARNISLEGIVKAIKIDAFEQVKAKGFETEFSVNIGDKTLSNTQTSLDVKIISPSYKIDKKIFIGLEEVQLNAKTRQNLKSGDIVIQTAQLSLPSLLEIGAQGNLSNWGKSFDLKVRMPKANLGAIWEKLPDNVRTQADGLTMQGTASMNIEAKAKIPTPKDIKKFNLPIQLAGRFGAQNVTISLPKLSAQNFNASADVNYKNDKGNVAVKVSVDKFKNEEIKASGKTNLTIDINGKIPSVEAARKLKIPLKIGARFDVENVSVQIPKQKLMVEGFNQTVNFNFDNGNAKIFGEISTDKLIKNDILKDQKLSPQFTFDYRLQSWNKLSFVKQNFKIPEIGVQVSGLGDISGFKPFLEKSLEPTPGNIISALNTSIKIKARLNTGIAPSLVKGMQTTGGLTANLNLNQIAGKTIEAGGNLDFDKFNFSMQPNLVVNEINGKLIFSKKLLINKRDLTLLKRPSITTAQKGFFSHLREFSPFKNIFTIKSLRFDKYKADNIGVDIFYKDNQLRVEKFFLDALSGGVAGNLFLEQTSQGPVLNFSTEFAELSFEDLTGQKINAPEEQTKIDGSLELSLKLNNKSKNVSLEEIEAKIAITRIGEEALDRVLLFLDPEESKPAIVSTRSKLKLATPHQLFIVLENGNLSVDIQLKDKILGNIIQAPGLKRISVNTLKQFKQISDTLNQLSQLKDVLQYLSAQGFFFDPDGKIQLF